MLQDKCSQRMSYLLAINLKDSTCVRTLPYTEASKSHTSKRIFADLPGHSLQFRPKFLLIPREPDHVIVDDENQLIELFDLICCGDTDMLIKGTQNRENLNVTRTFATS